MDKIIIGIHGLGNKPPKDLLEQWWRLSISEGLGRIGHQYQKFNFELVYWADFLHPIPLDPDEKDKDSELFIDEKYQPSVNGKEKKPKTFKGNLLNFFNKQRDKILFNETIHLKFPSITDLVVKHFFKDLDIYFTREYRDGNKQDCLARDLIHKKLSDALNKYKNRDVLIIAHSMGSIVMYEVLMRLVKEIKVRMFVTIGSPLGVPFILQKLKNDLSSVTAENNDLQTPGCITGKWINLADADDKLAQSADLEKLFKPNKKGIKPGMLMVDNDYEIDGIENPHKSYGYLRSLEMAHIIDEFLSGGKNKFILWLKRKFDTIKYKFIHS